MEHLEIKKIKPEHITFVGKPETDMSSYLTQQDRLISKYACNFMSTYLVVVTHAVHGRSFFQVNMHRIVMQNTYNLLDLIS